MRREIIPIVSFIGILTFTVGKSNAQRLKIAPFRMPVGGVLTLSSTIGPKPVVWSSSNPVVLLVQGNTATALKVGTAYLRAVYGNFRDSVLVTVTAPVLAAVTGITPVLNRLSYDTLGLDVSWSPVTYATAYQWRAFYSADSVTAVRQVVTGSPVAIKLPRRIGQVYSVCVRANGENTVGPDTCIQQMVADIDSLKLRVDSTRLTVGSTMVVCVYAWYRGKAMQGQPSTISISDTTILKIVAPMTDAQCAARLAPAQTWQLP